MNLLHIIPYYAPAWSYGGSVRAATDLTRALVTAGHRVTVLTTDTLSASERNPVHEETIDGVQVIRIRNRSNVLRGKLNLSSPVGFGAAARRLIKEHHIDVVHCHEVRTIENLLVAPVANQLKVPLVVSPHGTLPLSTGRSAVKQLWDRLFAGRLLPRFDQVIALTQNEAAEAREVWQTYRVPLPDEKISIVPNGIYPADFSNLPPGEPFRARWNLGDGPVVLFLGRLHERKGAQFLIPAFAEAVIEDARLLIVGPDEGMLAALQVLVREHHLEQQIIFTGMLTGTDRLAALAAADVFALPAVGEGFSMAVLEAMACGLPVLLTPGCNFPEVVAAGAGVVVEREITALCEALRSLLTDTDRRASMGRLAREMVLSRYTWDKVAAQMEQVYQAVIP